MIDIVAVRKYDDDADDDDDDDDEGEKDEMTKARVVPVVSSGI